MLLQTDSTACAIEVTGVNQYYGHLWAVRDLSLRMRPGEILGVIGRNGAGKTTTIEMICGLQRPATGTIKVQGFDAILDRRSAQAQIGYAPQRLAIYPPLTARQHVAFAAGLRGIGRRSPAITEALAEIALVDDIDRPCGLLSGGQQRRVSIAAALVHRPRVVILDEPTAAVDVESRRILQRWILGLKASETSVLYSTHYLEEAEMICDRVAIQHEGRIVECDTVPELQRRHATGWLRIGFEGQVGEDLVKELEVMTAGVVQASGEGIAIACSDPQARLVHVIASLYERKVAVRSVSVSEPSLESAFLNLTRRLREERAQ
jgi:ABC-2 type transport system ATP-binding protein